MSYTGPRILTIRNTYINLRPKKPLRVNRPKQQQVQVQAVEVPSTPPPTAPSAPSALPMSIAQLSSYGSVALLVLSEMLPFFDGIQGNGLIDILRKAVATKGPQTSSS